VTDYEELGGDDPSFASAYRFEEILVHNGGPENLETEWKGSAHDQTYLLIGEVLLEQDGN